MFFLGGGYNRRFRFGWGGGRFGRFRRFGRQARYGDGGRHVSCAGCFFILSLILAIGLGIGGAVMLASSSEDTRANRIGAYDDYVVSWKDYVRLQKYSAPPTVLVEAAVICNNQPGGKRSLQLLGLLSLSAASSQSR